MAGYSNKANGSNSSGSGSSGGSGGGGRRVYSNSVIHMPSSSTGDSGVETVDVGDYEKESFDKYEMTYFGFLDLNGDGKIDYADAEYFDKYNLTASAPENPVYYYLHNVKDKIKYPFTKDDVNVDSLMASFVDVDGDGKVTVKDATMLQQKLQKTGGDHAEIYEDGELVSGGPDPNEYKYDLNGDGKFDQSDIDIVQNYLIGKNVVDSIDPLKVAYACYDQMDDYSAEKYSVDMLNYTNSYFDYLIGHNGERAGADSVGNGEVPAEESLSDYPVGNYASEIEKLRGNINNYSYLYNNYSKQNAFHQGYKSAYLDIMSVRMTDGSLANLKSLDLYYLQLKDALELKRDTYNNYKESGVTLNNPPPEFTSEDENLLNEVTSGYESTTSAIDEYDYCYAFGTAEFYEFCQNYKAENAPADDKFAKIERMCIHWPPQAYYHSLKNSSMAGHPDSDNIDDCYLVAYLGEEYVMMYHYLLKTRGKDFAEKYLESINAKEMANSNYAMSIAMHYLNSLEYEDIPFEDYLLEHVDVDGDKKITQADYDKLSALYHSDEGISDEDSAKYDFTQDGVFDQNDLDYLQKYLSGEADGSDIDYKPLTDSSYNRAISDVEGYFEGFEFYIDGVKYNLNKEDIANTSVGDYLRSYIAMYLTSKGADGLMEEFNTGFAYGNMTIPYVTSALAYVVAYAYTENDQFANLVSKKIGLFMMAISAQGNYEHEARLEGHSEFESWLYASLCTGSEIFTEQFTDLFGNFGSSGSFYDMLINIGVGGLKEGAEEYVQTWIQAGIKSCMFGESYDISSIHEEGVKSFVIGFKIGTTLGMVSNCVNVKIDGVNYQVDSTQLALLDPNTDITLSDIKAIAVVDPSTKALADSRSIPLADASAIMDFVNAYDSRTRVNLASTYSSSEIIATLSYIQSTGDAELYSQMLMGMTDQQFIELMCNNLASQQFRDIIGDRNQLGCKIGFENLKSHTSTLETARKIADAIGHDKFNSLLPDISKYLANPDVSKSLAELNSKYGVSWDKIVEILCYDPTLESGPLMELKKNVYRVVDGVDPNNKIAEYLYFHCKFHGVDRVTFGNQVYETVAGDLANITHTETYLKLVNGELDLSTLDEVDGDGNKVYQDILDSDFYKKYIEGYTADIKALADSVIVSGDGLDKSRYLAAYNSLPTYEAKKVFYIECVVGNTLTWGGNLTEYIASSMYADETGKSFYDLSLEDRNKYISDHMKQIKNLSPGRKAVYERRLAADREAVAEGTIKRVEWLESQGHLKPGYTAEKVLGMIMNNVAPETYLSEDYVKEYWSKWKPDAKGNVKVVCFGSADVGAPGPTKFGANVGIPGEGAFVMPYEYYQDLCADPSLHNADGSWNTTALMNRLGGVRIGEQPVAIVQTVNIKDMKMPSGGMIGAYIGDWCPGGHTSSGVYVTNADGTVSLVDSALEGIAPPTNLFLDDGTLNPNISLELLDAAQKSDYIKRAATSMLDGAIKNMKNYGYNRSNFESLLKALRVFDAQGLAVPEDYMSYLQSVVAPEYLKTLDTSSFSKIVKQGGLPTSMLKAISNAITTTYDNGDFTQFKNIDFGKISADLAASSPEYKKFVASFAGSTEYSAEKVKIWSVLQYMQATKVINKIGASNFLDMVNKQYNGHGKTFTDPYEAFFGILNDSSSARGKLWQCESNINNAYRDIGLFHKRTGNKYVNADGSLMSAQEVEQAIIKEIEQICADNDYLVKVANDIAKANGKSIDGIDSFSSFQSEFHSRFTKGGAVGRSDRGSSASYGGMASTSTEDGDAIIIGIMDEVMNGSTSSLASLEDAFIEKYCNKLSLKVNQWKGNNFYRAIASNVDSNQCSFTNGVNINAFDLEWTLGGESLGMYGEFFVMSGTVDSADLGEFSKFNDPNNNEVVVNVYVNNPAVGGTYTLTYVRGIKAILEEMLSSGRVKDPNTIKKIQGWLKTINGLS